MLGPSGQIGGTILGLHSKPMLQSSLHKQAMFSSGQKLQPAIRTRTAPHRLALQRALNRLPILWQQ